jgi:hypothetical protein
VSPRLSTSTFMLLCWGEDRMFTSRSKYSDPSQRQCRSSPHFEYALWSLRWGEGTVDKLRAEWAKKGLEVRRDGVMGSAFELLRLSVISVGHLSGCAWGLEGFPEGVGEG